MPKPFKQSSSIQMSAIPDPHPNLASTDFTASFGQVVPPQQRIHFYSSDEWEGFIHEWVHYQKTIYTKVVRQSGAGDMGIDVAGYTDPRGIFGVWDNFQCKHYAAPLSVTDACKEIAKILWYSFKKEYVPPRAYFFVAPKGCATSLSRLLSSPSNLKQALKSKWEKVYSKSITTTQDIKLSGDFEQYTEKFDFSIFSQRTTLEIIDAHRKTPFHAIRFGGGLPNRPLAGPPPQQPALAESRYIEQLFDAYSDYKSCILKSLSCLSPWPDLTEHMQRQREYFYYAESLRNFARDSVPTGTFEELQDEVHAGVVDLAASSHPDGFARVNAVITAAAAIKLTSNPLIQVTKVQDCKGICHQLANEDRLTWKK